MKIIQFDDGKYAVMQETKKWWHPAKMELLDREGDWREDPSNWVLNALIKVNTQSEAQERLNKCNRNYKVIE
jgi:hypothetical protein